MPEFNFSKIEDPAVAKAMADKQKKFENLPEKEPAVAEAMADRREEVVGVAQEELEWKKQVKEWCKDPEIQKLVSRIEKNQKGITLEIMEKIQDIMEPHFALHGSHGGAKNFFNILHDGIFSQDYAKTYYGKDIKEKRNIGSDFKSESNVQQGFGRVSANSPAPMLNILEKILKDEASFSIYPIKIKNKDEDGDIKDDYVEKNIIKKIDDFLAMAKRQIRVNKVNIDSKTEYGALIGTVEVNKPVSLDGKEYIIRDSAVILGKQLEKHGMLPNSNYPLLSDFLVKIKTLFTNLRSDEVWHHNNVGLFQNIFSEVFQNFNNFKQEYLKFFYNEIKNYGNEQVLIDLDKIPGKLVNKTITRRLIIADVNDIKITTAASESASLDHSFETPISGRVKPKWFAGFIVGDKIKNVEFDEMATAITDLIKRTNIKNIAEGVLSENEIRVMSNIQKDEGKIDSKNLFLIASKICNYNFFDEGLNNKDLFNALANFGKLPAYNNDGDLIWPKKINHEEVKRFVAERGKQNEN